MKEARYSMILFYEKIKSQDLIEVEKWLEKGIILHIFIREKFKFPERLNYAKDYNFLSIYENCKFIDRDRIIAVDEEILDLEGYKIISEDKGIGFNNSQYEIITARLDKDTIVISGAGTGKTTTMINRLIFLKKTISDFDFGKIALITFTNKASVDMRERLTKTFERYYEITKDVKYLEYMDESRGCNISTIHKFAQKLINKYGKNIGINKEIKVASFKFRRDKALIKAIDKVFKEESYLYEVVKDYPIYQIEDRIMDVWDKINNYSIDIKDNTVDLGTDKLSIFIKKTIIYAQEIVNQDKKEQIELIDLIKLLSEDKLVNSIYDKYKLIMVDEFQDSDNIQIEFLIKFCENTGANFFVVGDEKQSIYRFRGAEYTAFIRLKELSSYLKREFIEFSMTQNYRTNSKILKEINDIFKRIDSKVECFNYGEKDYIYSNKNRYKEQGIVKENLELDTEKKTFYNELTKHEGSIAVLFRTNSEVREFKEFCEYNNFPCLVDDIGGFYRHKAVRDFYILIKTLVNPSNISNIYSLMHTPFINRPIDKNIVLECDSKNKADYFNEILESEGISKYIKLVGNTNIFYLIDLIIKELNPIKNLNEKLFKSINQNRDRIKAEEIASKISFEYKINLEYLIYLLKENFEDKYISVYQLEKFLKVKIATDNEIDPRKPQGKKLNGYIQCFTVHKAKGLEFDYVVLDRLNKRFNFENRRANIIFRNADKSIRVGYKIYLGENQEYKNEFYSRFLESERLEIIGEEARLLYVALTRCKQSLILNIGSNIEATSTPNTWKSLMQGVYSYEI